METIEGIELINQRIKDSLNANDLKAFDEVYIELFNKIRTLASFLKEPIIEGLDLTDEERVRFYIYASTRCKKMDKIANFESLRKYDFPYWLINYINNNQGVFYNLLVENKDIQREFSFWFKEHGVIDEKTPKDLYLKIFNLEEFRKIFLSDSKTIGAKFSHNYDFFELIPKDYAYLISLYNASKDENKERISNLYDMMYSSLLSEKDRLELMKVQIQLSSEPNLFGISISDIMMEFEYCLKQITEDANYLQIMNNISEKTGLDLKTIIMFASKYDSTNMYRNISLSNEISIDTIKKIEYLAKERKIKNGKLLDNIENVSIEELKQAKKDDNKYIKSNIHGGPRSKTTEVLFENGNERSIMIITSEGEVKEITIPSSKNHEDIVKKIYEYMVAFPDDCTSAIDRATYAAQKISSATLVIEMEMCFLIIPKELSEGQYNILLSLLEKANPLGQVGIITCDKDKKVEILFDGGCVSPLETKEYLIELKNQEIRQ